jgi:hypothetical protein
MAQQSAAQVAATEYERVEDKIEVLYERGDETIQMISKATDAVPVSDRAMRVPMQVTAGGKGGYVNLDGGDYGLGSGESYDVGTLTVVPLKMSFLQTFLAQYATDSRKKAIIDATQRIVTEGLKQFRSFVDKNVNATATGSLGTIGTVTGTTLTMNVPTGAQLVYENQTIQIYDATGTINRSAAAGMTTTVLAVDPVTAQTIVVDQLPPGTVATDQIFSDGLAGPTPVTLFTIKYHSNNATTGVWQNLNRATYPVKLATPRVNGNSGALAPMMPELCINKIRKSLGLNEVGNLVAHLPLEQKHAWDQLSTTVQIIDRAKHDTGESVDMNPTSYKNYNTGNMHGVRIKIAQNADQTRVDFLDLTVFGRCELYPMGFVKFANGKNWYQSYGASGGPAASMGFVYQHVLQIFNRNPRRSGFIDSLARPSGY